MDLFPVVTVNDIWSSWFGNLRGLEWLQYVFIDSDGEVPRGLILDVQLKVSRTSSLKW